MPRTTSGWQWPVEVTAMPALKSRNKLPSISSIVQPLPRTGTTGYARGTLGEVHWRSNSRWTRAFGPGSSVTMCGTAGAGTSLSGAWVTMHLDGFGAAADGCDGRSNG